MNCRLILPSGWPGGGNFAGDTRLVTSCFHCLFSPHVLPCRAKFLVAREAHDNRAQTVEYGRIAGPHFLALPQPLRAVCGNLRLTAHPRSSGSTCSTYDAEGKRAVAKCLRRHAMG